MGATDDRYDDWRLYVETMVSMIPEVPEVPEFPELHWTFSDGLYSIGEEDADRLLDYGENSLPLFTFELGVYEEKLQTILGRLSVDYIGD